MLDSAYCGYRRGDFGAPLRTHGCNRGRAEDGTLLSPVTPPREGDNKHLLFLPGGQALSRLPLRP